MTIKLSTVILATAVLTSLSSRADEMQDPSVSLVKRTVEQGNLVSDIQCVGYVLTNNE